MVLARPLITLLITTAILAGCASNPPAPVEERSTTERSNSEATTNTEVAEPDKNSNWRPNNYTVQEKDTMYNIGLRLGLDFKEIAAFNGIEPPYNIHPGQVLKIPENAAKITKEEEATTVPFGIDNAEVTVQSTTPQSGGIPVINEPKVFREPYTDEAFNRNTETIVLERSINRTTETTETTETTQNTPQVIPPKATQNNHTATLANITWAWPHAGKVIQGFGQAGNKGVDIAGKVGQTVNAAAAGKVIYSGSDLRGYGRMVIVKHNAMFLSVYAHNSHIYVKEGQLVSMGQRIAQLGSSASSRPKLHFEIRRQGKSINPITYLPKR